MPDDRHAHGAESRHSRRCPECGQAGSGPLCFHWDIAGERKIPTVLFDQQPQRQDALDDQLRDVRVVANRMGCYDAADWIRSRTL